MGQSVDVKMEWNSGETGAILNGPEIKAYLGERANAVATTARALAGSVTKSGEYRDSIIVEARHSKRARFAIVATAPYAMKLESQYGILTKALNANRQG